MIYNTLTWEEKQVVKLLLLDDLSFFIRFFVNEVEGYKFEMNWHHKEITNQLAKIFYKETRNLIINIPPRHSKTTMACYFTAWSIAKNPKSLFLYISASDKLTNDNSRLVRSIIQSQAYIDLFGVNISQDTTAKNHWRTNSGGGITTASINGQIIGFGAGALNDNNGFQGAIIIDDPNNPKTEGTIFANLPNERFSDTIRSRRNGRATPIIVIQQRTYKNDLSGFLLSGAGQMVFAHLNLPVLIEGKPLWEKKMGLDEILSLKKDAKTSSIFSAQYMQAPQTNFEGVFFKKGEHYDVIDTIPDNVEKLPYGLDFGYSPDPTAIIEAYICRKTNTIYLHEVGQYNELSNISLNPEARTISSVLINEAKVGDSIVISDTETKSINEIRGAGINIFPVRKGSGSVNQGIKIMQSFNILITSKSYNLIRQITSYARMKDPMTGEYMPKPDPRIRDKHCIDAARYIIQSFGTYWV